jgi:hypothetical protein
MQQTSRANSHLTSEHLESTDGGHDPVASRAYELWMLRGCPDGSPEVDWFQAESELNENSADASQSQAA